MMIVVKKQSNHRIGCEGGDRNIESIVAQEGALPAALTFDKRFVLGAKNFCQQVHAGLGKKDGNQAQPERVASKRFTEVVRNAGAEEVRQGGEEKMEGTGEAEKIFQVMRSDS